jgi:hypothetical protein
MIEHRVMKACEPRDLLDRVTDLCLFEGRAAARRASPRAAS